MAVAAGVSGRSQPRTRSCRPVRSRLQLTQSSGERLREPALTAPSSRTPWNRRHRHSPGWAAVMRVALGRHRARLTPASAAHRRAARPRWTTAAHAVNGTPRDDAQQAGDGQRTERRRRSAPRRDDAGEQPRAASDGQERDAVANGRDQQGGRDQGGRDQDGRDLSPREQQSHTAVTSKVAATRDRVSSRAAASRATGTSRVTGTSRAVVTRARATRAAGTRAAGTTTTGTAATAGAGIASATATPRTVAASAAPAATRPSRSSAKTMC